MMRLCLLLSISKSLSCNVPPPQKYSRCFPRQVLHLAAALRGLSPPGDDSRVGAGIKRKVKRLSFTCSEAPCLISRSWKPTRPGSRADFFSPKRVSSVGSCWSAGSSRVAMSMRGRRGRAGVGTIRLEEGRGADWLSEMSHVSNAKTWHEH